VIVNPAPMRRYALGSVVIVLLGIFCALLGKDRDRSSGLDLGPFSLSISRTIGVASLASRCLECTQPGDEITAVAHGGSANTIVIYAFHDDERLSTCVSCVSTKIVLSSLGRYELIGVDFAGTVNCSVNARGLEPLMTSATACGARIATVSIEVR